MRSNPRVWATLAFVWLVAASMSNESDAAPKGGRSRLPPAPQSSLTDHLQAADTSRWAMADGWANGAPFDNAWGADHVTFADSTMTIHLDDTAQLGEPYTSAEYRTTGYYGYGCYEVSMKPARNAGIVSAFFTYAGPWDNGGNGKHNEIDVEFPGTSTAVQFNFWTNDDSYSSRNEVLVPVGFDAADAFHVYAFKWTSTGIRWYVDGGLVYEAMSTPVNPTPKAEESLQKIMMNLWAVDQTAEAWAGTFVYPESPVRAHFDWVRFAAGEDCEFGPAPDEPEPPRGPTDLAGLYVAIIDLTLNTRQTQGIAKVTVRDEAGGPAEDVTVTSAWAGVVTTGDTTRVTGSGGVATFYSGRFRMAGEVSFCVLDLSRTGDTYDGSANETDCATVLK